MKPSSPTDVWLRVFDDAFGHPFESVTSSLDQVTEAEAVWQHPAYAGEAPEDGWPPPGTIAWHVAHLAHCKRHYTRILIARDAGGVPPVEPRVPLACFDDEVQALHRVHARQRDVVASLAPRDLALVVGEERRMSIAEFLAMTTRHDVWHAAQVVVVRRLYRASSG